MSAPTPDTVTGGGALRAYMLAQGAFFVAVSVMGVLMPWIYTQYLQLPASQVGIAQSISQLPMLLVLFGGAAADGQSLSSYLARLQLAMTLPAIVLGLLLALNALSLPAAVACAVAAATFAAFVMPARDALLAYAVPSSRALTQAVAAVTSAMFLGQMFGFALGSLATALGPKPLLLANVGLLVAAAILTARLQLGARSGPPQPRRSFGTVLNDIREGWMVVWRDARLRTITLIVAASSIAMNSAFVVGLPIMVRDIYRGTSVGIAALFIAFMLGTVITSAYLSRRKPIEAQGRVFMTFFLNSAMMFLGVHLAPPFWGAVLLVFGWGLGAGVGMVLSRSIIQAAAPPAFRARVLSVFQLAQTLGSIVGPFVLGAIIQKYGVLDAMLAIPFWVLFLWGAFSVLTPVWSFRRQEDHQSTAIDDPIMPVAPQEYLRSDHQGKNGGKSDDTLPGN